MITLCLWNWNWEQEYALGLGGILWDEVPDLALATVCDPTELEGVICEFGLYLTL